MRSGFLWFPWVLDHERRWLERATRYVDAASLG
jgi:hypothetical protein